MPNLRARTIRLAHARAELRPHLVPLLRTGKDDEGVVIQEMVEAAFDLLEKLDTENLDDGARAKLDGVVRHLAHALGLGTPPRTAATRQYREWASRNRERASGRLDRMLDNPQQRRELLLNIGLLLALVAASPIILPVGVAYTAYTWLQDAYNVAKRFLR